MPKSLRYQNQTGIASVILILIPVIIIIIVGVILYTQGIVKLPGKSTSPSSESSDVQVGLETKYDNPFDKSTQYQNPFSEYQNPFDELK